MRGLSNGRTVVLFSFLAASCTCGKAPKPVPTEQVGVPNKELPRELSPLPEVPAISVQPEELGQGGDLAVVSSRPNDTVEGEMRPTITFNKPVVALATIEQQASTTPPARIEPGIPGEWRWLGSASLEFVAKGLVPMATQFKVTVPAGLKALDGSALKEEHSYTFNTPRPELQSRDPENGFRWLRATPEIKLVFNQAVKDLDKHARFVIEGGQSVGLDITAEVSLAEELRAQEKDRHFERMAFEEKGFKNRQTRYELKPAAPLPLGKAVALVLDADLPGKEGPLTLGSEHRVEYRTYGAFQISRAVACNLDREYRCPWGPLVLGTTNQADLTSLKSRIKITPAAEIHWDDATTSLPGSWNEFEGEPTVMLPGKFKPGTRYTITIDAGTVDEFGQTAPAFSGEVRLDDVEPSIWLGSPNALLEATGDGNLPVESTNCRRLNVKAWSLMPAEAARALRHEDGKWSPAGTPMSLTVDLKGPKNVARVYAVPLRKVIGEHKGGIVYIEADSPDVPHFRREHVFAQLTDLAVHAKLGPRTGLAWVTSLSSGRPVGDAKLALYDENGNEKWSGTSNSDGLAEVPGLAGLIASPEYDWSTPYAAISAEKDDDTSITLTSWDEGIAPSAFGLTQAWEGTTPETAGLVFSERGIYRPGDEVDLKGILRYRRIGQLIAPAAGSKMELLVKDSRDKEVKKETVTVSRWGTFSAKVPIPSDGPLGSYSAQVTGSIKESPQEIHYAASFRVEEYRAPQFQVDVTTGSEFLTTGDALDATVLARYLYGGAMDNAKVRWSVNRSSTDFEPEGNQGWTFGKRTGWWDEEKPTDSSSLFASGEGEVDAKGMLAIHAGKAETPDNRAQNYTVEAEVEDVNRLRLANRKVVTVHPAAYYAGLKGPEGFPEAKKPMKAAAIAVTPDGKRAEGIPLKIEFVKRTWNNVRKKGVGGRYYSESEPVETVDKTCDLKSGMQPVVCEDTPAEAGSYILRATVTDSKGRSTASSMTLYVIGEGWVSWQRNDTDRIDLLPDKQTYDVGETAKVLVKSPYPEADALLTVEREGILERRRIHLNGSASTLSLPISEDYVPNVFASVVLVHPRVSKGGIETGDDPNRPAVRIGYVELKVEKKAKRLTVAVTPDAAEKRPRQETTVAIAVMDNEAHPVKDAEVTVYAVDEGVLRLTGYETPDPIASIFPERGLSVRLGEPLIHLVRQRHYGEKGEDQGGGGGADATGSGFRSKFKTTVLFAPSVVTDGAGKAQVKFSLPDNLTTFRIMAVAATAGDHFGKGDSKIVVNKPLLVLPALPRIARVGDKFEAGVVVHSYGAGTGDVTVTAEVQGGATISGEAKKTIAVAQGKAQEVRFSFEAANPGKATLRFLAVKGDDSDGVEEKLPIELPVQLETVATYGDTTDERQEGLTPPKDVWTDIGGLETTLSSTILGDFDEGMRQLIDYPYGCVEQLSSRLVPFIALRGIYGKFKVPYQGMPKAEAEKLKETNAMLREFLGFLGDTYDATASQDPDEIIRASIKSIERLQSHNGGFRYWSSSECTDPWASAYATMSLSRAKDVGYPVDAEVLSNAEQYLERVAGGWCDPCYFWCSSVSDETRAFSLYTLARMGKPKPSYYDELLKNRNKLSMFGKALLTDAMYVGGGDRKQAKALLTEIMNGARETPREVHFEEVNSRTYAPLWASDTRTTGLVLQTLADVTPDHPYVAKIGNYLTTIRTGGRWRNTQEAAWSLIGLTEVVRVKEKEEPDFKATVSLGNKPLFDVAFKGRSMGVAHKFVPMKDLTALAGKGDLPFLFSKDGPGVLYYGALMRYAPKEIPLTPLERGITVQRWFEPFTGGGQATKFYAGDLVRVRVRVATPQERNFVVVDVPLPAGLEPIDTSLASTAKLPSAPGEETKDVSYESEGAEDEYSDEEQGNFNEWATRFWSPFNHVEQRDDRVALFADHMPPGVHVSSFVARATTPGDFLMKPAKAEEMYTPEVFGRSNGGRFTIVLPPTVAEK
jgi:alpha-2-macroglobulin